MINTYSVMLNEDRIPYLRLDDSVKYAGEKRLQTPQLIVDLVNAVFNLENCAEENLIAIALTTKCQVLGLFHVSRGSVISTEASPRNILQRMLLCGAAAFAVCHNHPSGDSSFSEEDLLAADKIEKAGKLIGIQMCDFISIGNGEYQSIAELKKRSV